ncbi:50S ribosomal protein L28 [Candidatus Gottesmanbacteria bacterium RBG_16_37_8]|uniref:Large ribosomal subunit protein bL28 n=1 Tax=Candidatus Gottesmanbacteria bacterium RBG_16_37_8 TaxID=1798371 RepID=A0A1F5YSA6_9BACT|nr:MAG: 50S ribosomal protein L28 [Candidatus Gottesmanbacteria bacterium RBG_16_37_8]
MALICDNCRKGIGYGHAVSHAKNRVNRIFKPNIQKLKVLRDGIKVRVKLCTNCIQRLKKDRQIGHFRLIQYIKADKIIKEVLPQEPKIKTEEKKEKKEEKVKPELNIEDIVGKA